MAVTLCRKCLTVVVCLVVMVTVARAASIRIDEDDEREHGVKLKRMTSAGRSLYSHYPTVHHFARHVVCRTWQGKREFYLALGDILCEVSEAMKQSLVLDVCKRKGDMLDKWVAEIYDSDQDGYISHREKSYHLNDRKK